TAWMLLAPARRARRRSSSSFAAATSRATTRPFPASRPARPSALPPAPAQAAMTVDPGGRMRRRPGGHPFGDERGEAAFPRRLEPVDPRHAERQLVHSREGSFERIGAGVLFDELDEPVRERERDAEPLGSPGERLDARVERVRPSVRLVATPGQRPERVEADSRVVAPGGEAEESVVLDERVNDCRDDSAVFGRDSAQDALEHVAEKWPLARARLLEAGERDRPNPLGLRVSEPND